MTFTVDFFLIFNLQTRGLVVKAEEDVGLSRAATIADTILHAPFIWINA